VINSVKMQNAAQRWSGFLICIQKLLFIGYYCVPIGQPITRVHLPSSEDR